jgi:sulfate permease, SulP family
MTVADGTGAAMLRQLTTDLDRDGIRLAIAREVGQVRDVLAHAGGPTVAYPTVDEAVAAVLDRPTPS